MDETAWDGSKSEQDVQENIDRAVEDVKCLSFLQLLTKLRKRSDKDSWPLKLWKKEETLSPIQVERGFVMGMYMIHKNTQ